MTEDQSQSDQPDPFSAPNRGETDVPPGPEMGAAPSTGPGGAEASVALEMARMWIQEHQKAAMLGAFATGVFAGALLRE